MRSKNHNNITQYRTALCWTVSFVAIFFLASIAFALPSSNVKNMGNSIQNNNITGNINAELRNGQIFLTWSESPDNMENIRIYISDKRITSSNLENALLLTDELQSHSANDWTVDPNLCPRANGPARGWIIKSGAKPLDKNGGLFVHTVTEDDPKKAYFAVLANSQTEKDIKQGVNSTNQPVNLSKQDIEPICQSGRNIAPSKGMPVALYLHPHTSRPAGQFTHVLFGDKSMGWREGLAFKFKVSVLDEVILVEPYDRVWIGRKPTAKESRENYDRQYKNIETWWYGTKDNINIPEKSQDAAIVNYTERKLLYIIDWLIKRYNADPNRIYGFGTSMGTGVLRLVFQNPEKFASADVLVPFVDFKFETQTEQGNVKRKAAALGDLSQLSNQGIPLSQRFNLVKKACTAKTDLPFVVIRAGREDISVGWKRKPAFFKCLQDNNHGLLAGWDNGDHSTAMRKTLEGFPDFMDYSWHIKHFALNKSFPAFSNFSSNKDPGDGSASNGDIVGFINYGLDWKVIEDNNDIYQIEIFDRFFKDTKKQVDITPRRRQSFLPSPGSVIIAQNQEPNGEKVETKRIIVDDFGNITFKNFQITNKNGNKLVLLRKNVF